MRQTSANKKDKKMMVQKTKTKPIKTKENIIEQNDKKNEKIEKNYGNFFDWSSLDIVSILPNNASKTLFFIALLLGIIFFVPLCEVDFKLFIPYMIYLFYLLVRYNFKLVSFLTFISVFLFAPFLKMSPINSAKLSLPFIEYLFFITCLYFIYTLISNLTVKKLEMKSLFSLSLRVGWAIFILWIFSSYISFFKNTSVIDIEHYCQILKLEQKSGDGSIMKPIIYLYPEQKTEVTVKLGDAQKISHSYPKYENKWLVTAKPNGDLTYNNRSYYGLYWEGKNAPKFELDEGFVVKGSASTTFLEEKLAILGLNEREANEFIIYWLPKLENNPYNFIKFASMEAQNEYMPLEINPKPDTLIRVMIAYKKLDNPIEVKEQVLEPAPTRNGFVVIEWGGTEIGDNFVY